ncbi:FBD domain [Dillenia turbinata]|uniref:FBD domain n=1 Tax=Dillenia turbinata TaxID=194707 RepID=A0AAN8ZU48_9MAGN
MDGVDRFSNLPVQIILHILSLLPTKFAVSTSVLSTKFKSLWLDLTNFDFDDNLLFNPAVKRQISYPVTFQNFVESVLTRSSSPTIHKFALRCKSSVEDLFIVNDWIKNVINRKVQEIVLSIEPRSCGGDDVEIPKPLFVSRTLVVLKLNLRLLELSIPDFDEDEVWFPNLKDLCVEGDLCSAIVEILVSGSRLKRVKLDLRLDGSMTYDYKFVIDGVCLDVIDISDNFLGCYVMPNLISVDTAIVDVSLFDDPIDTSPGLKRATEFLNSIIMVKSLKLSARTINRLMIESFQLPTFYNLTRLESAFYNNYLYPSLEWLKCTPILRVLVLCRDGMQPFQSEWFNAAEPVPLCLKEHLKVIQYKGFQGEWDEIGMLKYMLKNGEVLSEILVEARSSGREGNTTSLYNYNNRMKYTQSGLKNPLRKVLLLCKKSNSRSFPYLGALEKVFDVDSALVVQTLVKEEPHSELHPARK